MKIVSLCLQWYLFFADSLFSYILAAMLYLAVEAPVNNILNHIFKGKIIELSSLICVIMNQYRNCYIA